MTTKAFTLIEILVAVMLTGLLAALALAPVASTVRRVVDTQEEYSDIAALSRTMNFITRDLNSAMRLASNVITVKDHESLGGHDDDVLLIMSTAPTAQNLPSGTLVYKVNEGGMMHHNIIPGLYRWIFPGKLPNAVNTDSLNDEEGQLVLPGVSEFCVEVPAGAHEEDRRKSYSGPMPAGLYIRMRRGNRSDTNYSVSSLNDDELRNDEIESIIVFP
ncbi:MAG: prepilin-type N-terminal cleavage/methylation domain-containing protein [Synergistaceae bacterium]|nr:prepilin-type N-terminal cleavage/methylation domain-containing protein [Synergistaceae bacterium]